MLINCPRCGFQQPIDKYCAQCGVDMETFRPAPQPFFKRFFGSVTVQITMLVAVAVGASVFIYNRGQDNIENRVSYLKSTVQIQAAPETVPTAAEQLSEFEESSTSYVADQASQSPNGEGGAGEADSSTGGTPSLATATVAASPEYSASASASASPLASPSAGRAVARSSAHLVVTYAEVDRSTLAGLVSSSRGTGQYMSFNDYSAGILPRIKAAIGAVKVLHKEDRVLASDVKSVQWFLGLTDPRDPSRQMGFNTYFEINDSDARNLRGNIEVLRTWREESTPGAFELQKKTFPAIFEIGGDTGFFMYGIMPRQSHLTDESDLLKIDLYKILSSPAFRAAETEFVIFVEYDRNN